MSSRVSRNLGRFAPCLLAVTGFSVVTAADCIRRKDYDCLPTGGGYFQGTVVACGAGWTGGHQTGYSCTSVTLKESECMTFDNCAPGPTPCSVPPQDAFPTGCGAMGGQCCFCKTLVGTSGSGKEFLEYDSCSACDETPSSGQ